MALISSPLVFWAGSNTSYPGRMKKILRYHRDSGEIEKQPVDTFKRSSPHKENCFFFFLFFFNLGWQNIHQLYKIK